MTSVLERWLETDFGKAVVEHVNCGFKVFPLHGVTEDGRCTCGMMPCGKDNRGAGKHPYAETVKRGFLDATDNIEVIGRLFEYRKDLNVGIATGEPSGIFVIDVDDKNNGRGSESLQKLEAALGNLPETMIFNTGNGFHLIFDYPKKIILKNGINTFGEEYPDIDTRGAGGYIVAPPSRHFTGRMYRKSETSVNSIADIPEKYLPIILEGGKKRSAKVPEIDIHRRSGATPVWGIEDVINALSYLDPDMSYSEWNDIGMALHDGGYEMALFNEWSSRGKKYGGIKDVNKHWRSYRNGGGITMGTLIERAALQGWKPINSRVDRMPTAQAEEFCSILVEKMKKKVKLINPVEVSRKEIKMPPKRDKGVNFSPKFTFDPLQIEGPIGEIVRWITNVALYEQPELALLNALAWAGAVFGRRYASPLNTRTNVYLVAIARTGSGKDHSRKMINSLAMESGLSNYMGGNSIRSDTGLLRGLMRNTCQLLQLDEFGKFMQALSDSKAPFHAKNIITALTKLYSDSGGAYHHGDYADPKAEPISIAFPNLCIYGTSTEREYIKSVHPEAIASGDLNRFIVIPTRREAKSRRHIPPMEKRPDIVEWWNQFAPSIKNSLAVNINNASTAPTPKIVEWGECDDLQYSIRKEAEDVYESDHPFADLYGRLYENTIKIAMIFAIARDPETPVLTHVDFDYAYSIVKNSIAYMEAIANSGMAENQQEASNIEVINFIKDSREVSRADLMRKFRKYNKRQIDDIISSLVDADEINVERVEQQAGRPKIVYVYVG